METISAVIITCNEQRNIGRCLQSIADVADEVIVVDSGSTDDTEAICTAAGARFVSHPWEGFAEQKNYADRLATADWILSIDADEALSDTLRESLLRMKKEGLDRKRVYSLNRLTNYCGHWVRHCGWYPDRCLRLWPNDGTVSWDGIIHESLRMDSPLTPTPIEGDLLHYSYYSEAEHIGRIATYAPLSAQKDYDRGRRCGALAIALRPVWTFVRSYLLKGGFLDGSTGFVVCRLSACYTLVKYSTLYRMSHDKDTH